MSSSDSGIVKAPGWRWHPDSCICTMPFSLGRNGAGAGKYQSAAAHVRKSVALLGLFGLRQVDAAAAAGRTGTHAGQAGSG